MNYEKMVDKYLEEELTLFLSKDNFIETAIYKEESFIGSCEAPKNKKLRMFLGAKEKYDRITLKMHFFGRYVEVEILDDNEKIIEIVEEVNGRKEPLRLIYALTFEKALKE